MIAVMNDATTFEQYRSLLFSIAYRMLGGVAEAEDMVQETFLRWQRRGDEVVQSDKALLTTIITRLCIDHLKSARHQREQYVGVWLPEPLLEPDDDDPAKAAELADSLTNAFLLIVETLSPVERAVFLLHEVFDYDYAEVSRIVGKSEANCRQMAVRAREHLAARRPRFQADRDHAEQLLNRFLLARAQGDSAGAAGIAGRRRRHLFGRRRESHCRPLSRYRGADQGGAIFHQYPPALPAGAG